MDHSRRYWDIVNSLVERGITTRDMWRVVDPTQFSEVLKCKLHGFKIKNILCDVVKCMAMSKCAKDYIFLSDVIFDSTNPIFQICLANDVDPLKLAKFMLFWSAANLLGKVRNVFWIQGKPETGARLLFDAVTSSVPLVRYADWMHPENPFIRCSRALMVGWDNGRISKSHLDMVMKVFSGEYICYPLPPPKLKFEMFCTPVLLWGDDDVLYVHSNECIDVSTSSKLRLLISKLSLKVPMPERVTCISVNDVRSFIKWGSSATEDTIVTDIECF